MEEKQMMEENELIQVSTDFGKNYMLDRIPTAHIVEKSLCVNAAAHGFHMGVRSREKLFKKMFGSKRLSVKEMEDYAEKGAKFYVTKKFPNMHPEDKALVSISVKRGFLAGMNFCESKVYSPKA